MISLQQGECSLLSFSVPFFLVYALFIMQPCSSQLSNRAALNDLDVLKICASPFRLITCVGVTSGVGVLAAGNLIIYCQAWWMVVVRLVCAFIL